MMQKFLSWNVNGIRAAIKKGLPGVLNMGYDIVALQETKADDGVLPESLKALPYHIYSNPAAKKGYSGTLALSEEKPLKVLKGIGNEDFDNEGRVLALEFEKFWFINAYFPNSQRDLARLGYKLGFDRAFEKWCSTLDKGKPLVICGDLNVAHEDIDIARPKENLGNAGFTIQEREWLTGFLGNGYVDAFRHLTKEGGHYTWWSYMFGARAKNIGWRIDYFIVSKRLAKRVKSSTILDRVIGSDHVPVDITIDF